MCMLICFQSLDILIAACQEEKDQTRNQNPRKPERRNQHHPARGYSKGPCGTSQRVLLVSTVTAALSKIRISVKSESTETSTPCRNDPSAVRFL